MTAPRTSRRARRVVAATALASVAVPWFAEARPAAAETAAVPMVGLLAGSFLVHFDAADPSTITGTVLISGLQPGERVGSIDVRPGTGQLLALAVSDGAGADTGRLYSIDPLTGRATATGPALGTIDDTARTVIDINPTVDRLRVVGSLDQNLRVNPNNGALAATDTPLAPGGEQVVGIAYDRNVAAAAPGGLTTLFGITSDGDLVRIGGVDGTPSPNAGAVTTVGSLGADPDDDLVGFDIAADGTAFASMAVGGTTRLYRIDLVTGAATVVEEIGNGLVDVGDISVLVTPDVPLGASQYVGLPAATRLLDTRGGARPEAGGTLTVPVQGVAGSPGSATAVVLNVTVTDPAAPGFTTVWPSGRARPTASSVNTDAAGQTRAALVTVPVGADGSVSIFTERGSHVVVDAVGSYRPASTGAGRFVPLVPGRLLDTRSGLGTAGGSTTRPAAREVVEVAVAGRAGVPATGVAAVVVNLTATEAAGPGFVTAYPGGDRPTASNLNVSAAGETIANLAVVPLSASGSISLFTEAGTHLLADVVGYVSADANALATPRGLFVPVAPDRVLDTRLGLGAPTGSVAPGTSLALTLAGRGGLPAAGVLAAAGTLTMTETASAGYVTLFPGGDRPTASTVNADAAGRTVANAFVVALENGAATAFTEGRTQLVADVVGYYLD